MKVGAKEYSLWTIAITLVLLFALIPVLWLLSISLKPPSEITDQRSQERAAAPAAFE